MELDWFKKWQRWNTRNVVNQGAEWFREKAMLGQNIKARVDFCKESRPAEFSSPLVVSQKIPSEKVQYKP